MKKPFSLDEYRKNPSRKIVTGDGRKVRRILCTDAKGNYPVVALVERQDGTGDEPIAYTKDGNYIDGVVSFVYDLFFVTEKHEGWVNLYLDAAYNSGELEKVAIKEGWKPVIEKNKETGLETIKYTAV